MGFFRQNVAIDLGTDTILLFLEKKGVVVDEPSIVAVKKGTKTIVAIGDEAKTMLGRAETGVELVRPVRGGMVSDFTLSKKLISYHLNSSIKNFFQRILKPDVMIAIPLETTEVEKRAVERVAQEAGCARVFMIEEPLAAAVGAGLDVENAVGSMIVDIGGGTTDVAVVSFQGVAVGKSIKTAGEAFDRAITEYIRSKYAMHIGPLEAENIKKNIGCLYHGALDRSMEVRGTDVVEGKYKEQMVSSEEIMEPMLETAVPILDCIKDVLERTPPELAGDIYQRGILMTGNGSLIKGFDEIIRMSTGIDVRVAQEPGRCVVRGAYKALQAARLEQKK